MIYCFKWIFDRNLLNKIIRNLLNKIVRNSINSMIFLTFYNVKMGIFVCGWKIIGIKKSVKIKSAEIKRRSKVTKFSAADQNFGRPPFRPAKFVPTKLLGRPPFRLTFDFDRPLISTDFFLYRIWYHTDFYDLILLFNNDIFRKLYINFLIREHFELKQIHTLSLIHKIT